MLHMITDAAHGSDAERRRPRGPPQGATRAPRRFELLAATPRQGGLRAPRGKGTLRLCRGPSTDLSPVIEWWHGSLDGLRGHARGGVEGLQVPPRELGEVDLPAAVNVI